MFEHRTEPLLPRKEFVHRVLRSFVLSTGIIGVALGAGALGYRLFEGLPWLDSIENAAMILSSMGPLHHPATDGGKIFATVYALGSGIVFITATGILLAPPLHRLLHALHLEE